MVNSSTLHIPQVNFALMLLGFRLLQAQYVRLVLLHERHKKPLFVHCPYSVYIPGNYFHLWLIMELFMYISQVFVCYVSIYLCGTNIRMAEHGLYGAYVCAV